MALGRTTADYCTIAVEAARRAGRIHMRYFGKDAQVRAKSKSYDLLTVADTESEREVVAFIRKKFPAHNFLAEENTYPRSESPYTWIIDPLDGTNNFACGVPIFCASVALAYKTEVIAAAVYDPTRREMFHAAKGHGAFLNGRRIRVACAHTLKESLMITGFYYDRGKHMYETLAAIGRFHRKEVIGVRRLGAAALDLCYVASGRAAGFWEFRLSPWDFAAGMLLIKEAGGIVTDREGKKLSPLAPAFVVASNRRIHSAMLSVIGRA